MLTTMLNSCRKSSHLSLVPDTMANSLSVWAPFSEWQTDRHINLYTTLTHGRRKRGYAGDLTPPTIYVGDIDMYIPLEKPNT